MGQLMKCFGPHGICCGSGSLCYKSPQWQIKALWRFQIPDQIAEQWGYPQLSEGDKRHMLGLNAARLCKVLPVGGVLQFGVCHPVPSNFDSQIPDSLNDALNGPGYPPG
jgi:hypothetical protein